MQSASDSRNFSTSNFDGEGLQKRLFVCEPCHEARDFSWLYLLLLTKSVLSPLPIFKPLALQVRILLTVKNGGGGRPALSVKSFLMYSICIPLLHDWMMVKAKVRQPLLIYFIFLNFILFHSFSIIFSIFFIHFTLKWVWYRRYYLEIISRNNFRINGNESVNDLCIWWQNPYFPRVVCFLKVKTIWFVIYKKGRTIISPWKYEWCR